jgi:hypothetical protein
MIRLLGAAFGVATAGLAFVLVPGVSGIVAGFLAFLICTSVAELMWRRRSTADEIRRDLEDRVRNPPS